MRAASCPLLLLFNQVTDFYLVFHERCDNGSHFPPQHPTLQIFTHSVMNGFGIHTKGSNDTTVTKNGVTGLNT
jgi:hypothetical protein